MCIYAKLVQLQTKLLEQPIGKKYRANLLKLYYSNLLRLRNKFTYYIPNILLL